MFAKITIFRIEANFFQKFFYFCSRYKSKNITHKIAMINRNTEAVFKKLFSIALWAALGSSCFLFSGSVAAQTIRLEAEKATLSGGGDSPAQIKDDSSCSGGKYVDTRGGNLAFSLTIATAGNYAVIAKAKSPYGDKINTFRFDGGNSKDISFSKGDNFVEVPIVDSYYFSAGTHKIEMIASWGWIWLDYIEIKPSTATPVEFDIQPLVTPQPSVNAAKLYQFLLDNFQHKIISGVMTLKSLATTTGDSQNEISWLYDKTGKKPALLGLDFMDHTGATNGWQNNPDVVKDAITWKDSNGIVALCWHWRDPSYKTYQFYTYNANSQPNGTSFDPRKIFEPQSPEYAAMMRDMDIVAGYLKELQAAGVPVLWRPLHEASGGWFWWGSQGPEACKKIWQTMFDKFTNEHHLNNLIWVWTSEANANALNWYPGDEYVDIVGLDIYAQGDHGSQMLTFEELKKIFKGKKLLTLSECGSIPDIAAMKRDRSIWSYYMPWYGNHTKNPDWNTVNDWANSLSDPDVIALDDMPANFYSSIAPPDTENLFSVHCNQGQVNIQTTYPSKYQAKLYDLTGRLCLTKDELQGNQTFPAPAGLNQTHYLLAINSEHDNVSCKLLIIKK